MKRLVVACTTLAALATNTGCTKGESDARTTPEGNTTDSSLSASLVGIPHATGIYSFGDGVTTMELSSPEPGKVCLAGTGASNFGPAYDYWGAGIGIQLAEEDANGNVTPFDAPALGVAQVSFTLEGVPRTGIRVGVTMSGDMFVENSFIVNGAEAADVRVDGSRTLSLSSFAQPPWGLSDTELDPSFLHSLLFQMVTAEGQTVDYDYCVSDVALLDASGGAVEPGALPSTGITGEPDAAAAAAGAANTDSGGSSGGT